MRWCEPQADPNSGGQNANAAAQVLAKGITPNGASMGDCAATDLARFAHKPRRRKRAAPSVASRADAMAFAPARQRPWVADEWGGITDDALLVAILVHVPMRLAQRLARLSKQVQRIVPRVLEAQLTLGPEQAVAFLDAMRGHNVFLTGGAGCGKSHTLKVIKQHLDQEQFVTTASTGCAAAIIGAVTFHSCCGIGLGNAPTHVLVNRIKKENRWVFNRLRGMRTLIVDEVGMLDGQLFDKAGQVVGEVRRDFGGDYGALVTNQVKTAPYHGLQLIVCGDFMQLPPVKVDSCGWVFSSKAWKALAFRNHVLTRVHRQGADPEFAHILGRMRLGVATHDDWRYLVQHCAGDGAPEPMGEGDPLRLFAKNAPADAHNNARFEEAVGQLTGWPFWKPLDARPTGVGTARTFRSTPYPIYAINWAPKGTEHRLENCPVPAQLWLCVGARVMCLKNITDRLVNGSVGTVHGVERAVKPDQPLVVIGIDICVRFDGQLGEDAFFHTFHTHRDGLAEDVNKVNRFSVRDDKQKEVAYRIQIPLRHAWACSIHKAQGCSIERVVIDFEGCFADGQAYTALSRVRTLAGAWLVNLRERHMGMVSRQAKRWYETLDVQQWE